MPGAKDHDKRPNIFERFNILKKIKEVLGKGWDALKTATTAVAVRVLGGKEEFSKYVAKQEALMNAAEISEAKNYSVGDKVAVEMGQFHIEGTVLQKSENEQGEFVTVELCDGKVQTFPAEAVETVAYFKEKNAELPKEYRKTLIDAESYSKYADIVKREQELKEQSDQIDKQKEKPLEEQDKVDIPEVGEKFVFLETTKVNDLDMVLSGTEVTVTGVSKDEKSVLMQGPDGKAFEVSVDALQDWRAMPKEIFETTYQDGNFVVKSPENQQGEMASVYVQKQHEKAEAEKEAAQDQKHEQEKDIDNTEKENTETPKEYVDELFEQTGSESEQTVDDVQKANASEREEQSDAEFMAELQAKMQSLLNDSKTDATEQKEEIAEEPRFEVFEDLQNEVDEVKSSVEEYLFNEEEQKWAEYEAYEAEERAHQPVELAENRDSLTVGAHFAYSFKGKYQEATVTAINKKSIDIQTNDGREYQIKNADKEKAVFGYEEIKADKDVASRVMDQNSTKFSDMFRNAYEKADDQRALEAEAEELGIDLYGGELDDLDFDYDDIDVDEGPTSLFDQINNAREEANSRNAVNKDAPSRDDDPLLGD